MYIKADLLVKGHLVKQVINVKSKYSIAFEAPRSTIEIVQCQRCEQFSHTKMYFQKPFLCMKYGFGHPTPNFEVVLNVFIV